MVVGHIVKKLELSDKIEHIARNPTFITLNDHKKNFNSKLPYLLINSSKRKVGKSTKKTEKINKITAQHLYVTQLVNRQVS